MQVTVGAWDYAPGTVIYFSKDKLEFLSIHNTWEGGEEIMCAVFGEGPSHDNIVKE